MDYPAFLRTNVQAFLDSRGLAFDELRLLASRQGFDDALLLLTSSPVHGIATPTSDVDLVCICPGAVSAGQMATQIHHNGHHVEVLPFAAADVQAAFTAWTTLAASPLAQRLDGYRDWDRRHPLRLKYLERLVYGVSPEGDTPFALHRPATARIVAASDFDLLHQNLVCACLARRAGETAAMGAYLMNGCLAVMNLLLSQGGWVLSNRKWTLRRWWLAGGTDLALVDPGRHRQVSHLWSSLEAGRSDPHADTDGQALQLAALQRLHQDLYPLVAGEDLATASHDATPAWNGAALAAGGTRSPMDARAAYLHASAGWSRLESFAALPEPPAGMAMLGDLPAAAAARLLRALRAGEWHCSLRAPAVTTHEEPADVDA